MLNHVESLFSAVSVLAGHGNIKERLVRAYEHNLTTIEEHELPDPVRPRFIELRRMMNRVSPLNGEGPICASVRKMSVGEADECAQLMVGMYAELARLHEELDGEAPPKAEEKAAVPPFLVKSN